MIRLVAVVSGLVGSIDGDVEVLGLDIGKSSKLHTELSKVSTGDLLVELLREHVDAEREGLGVGPESDLSEDLVGEGAGHDKRRVAGSAAASRSE